MSKLQTIDSRFGWPLLNRVTTKGATQQTFYAVTVKWVGGVKKDTITLENWFSSAKEALKEYEFLEPNPHNYPNYGPVQVHEFIATAVTPDRLREIIAE